MFKRLYSKIGKKIVKHMAKHNVWNNKFVSSFLKYVYAKKNKPLVYKIVVVFQMLNESYELLLFKKKVKTGMNVIDIGANFGVYTLEASKLIGEDGHVYAFEPEPSTFEVLEKRVNKAGLKNVSLYTTALSDKLETKKLYFDEANVGDHSFSKTNTYRGDSFHNVETSTLDKIFKDINVDVIKIDTQGAEGLVMKGGQMVLKRDKPIMIFGALA